MSSRKRLTPALRQKVLAGIRAGGFPQVAAEAWGVPRDTFDSWRARGAGKKAREPYRSFARDVLEAQGQARLKAEIEVFQNHARDWLEHGPGRDTPDRPGWSSPVKPSTGDVAHPNPWVHPAWVGLLHSLGDLLRPYPEAQQVVADFASRA